MAFESPVSMSRACRTSLVSRLGPSGRFIYRQLPVLQPTHWRTLVEDLTPFAELTLPVLFSLHLESSVG